MLGRAGLVALLLLVSCEKAGPTPGRDAAPPRPADAAPPPPVDAGEPDAAPPADAGPLPPRDELDRCATDADCTTYFDACVIDVRPVNKRFAERARAAAEARCPNDIGGVLGIRMEDHCVKGRCRHGDDNAIDDVLGGKRRPQRR